MADLFIEKVKIKDREYEIHAAKADKATQADSATTANKTQCKLTIGTYEFDGHEDVSVPVYSGEINN